MITVITDEEKGNGNTELAAVMRNLTPNQTRAEMVKIKIKSDKL